MTARYWVIAFCCALATMAFSGRLMAQQTGPAASSSASIVDDELFVPPMADQSEPADRIRYGGSEIDFGLALPLTVYTSEGQDSGWQIGFLGGIVAGFGSERTTLYLKSADFHAGIPISFRKGKWSARFQFYHVSSHLGGDYQNLSGFQDFHYSREEIQGLVAYDLPHHVRIYGGPRVLVRTYPSVGRWTFQAGTEWFPPSLSGHYWKLYLADDFQTRQEVKWQTNISIEPGIQWTTRKGEPITRLEAWFYSGQEPFGELYTRRERVLGAQVIFTLKPALKSIVLHRH
ncbi:MAG: DUF1207 domain-containing protein [Terriglobia bacterium]